MERYLAEARHQELLAEARRWTMVKAARQWNEQNRRAERARVARHVWREFHVEENV